jgi:hypothetical protein
MRSVMSDHPSLWVRRGKTPQINLWVLEPGRRLPWLDHFPADNEHEWPSWDEGATDDEVMDVVLSELCPALRFDPVLVDPYNRRMVLVRNDSDRIIDGEPSETVLEVEILR